MQSPSIHLPTVTQNDIHNSNDATPSSENLSFLCILLSIVKKILSSLFSYIFCRSSSQFQEDHTCNAEDQDQERTKNIDHDLQNNEMHAASPTSLEVETTPHTPEENETIQPISCVPGAVLRRGYNVNRDGTESVSYRSHPHRQRCENDEITRSISSDNQNDKTTDNLHCSKQRKKASILRFLRKHFRQ